MAAGVSPKTGRRLESSLIYLYDPSLAGQCKEHAGLQNVCCAMLARKMNSRKFGATTGKSDYADWKVRGFCPSLWAGLGEGAEHECAPFSPTLPKGRGERL